MNYASDESRESPLGMFFPEDEDTAIYLKKHFALGRAHGVEDRLATQDSRDDRCSPFLRDPEPGCRGIDDPLSYFTERDERGLRDAAAIDTEEGKITLPGESEDSTESFHCTDK